MKPPSCLINHLQCESPDQTDQKNFLLAIIYKDKADLTLNFISINTKIFICMSWYNTSAHMLATNICLNRLITQEDTKHVKNLSGIDSI